MKIVTVGTSQITSLLIAAFKKAGIEVFACIGRGFEKTKEFAERNGVPYHATDYDKALESDLYDTLYLGLPNSLHYPYARKALEKGKNVIVEKPFASNMKEAKELIDIANNKGLLIFNADTLLYDYAYRKLKEDIKLLGKIRMVEIDYYKYSSRYDSFLKGETPNIFSREYSGGALMDLGVYNIEFSVGLFGLPYKVNYFPNIQRGIDTSGVVILEYDGFIVNAVNGKDADKASGFRILGEKGYIHTDQYCSHFDHYEICLNDGSLIERDFVKSERYENEVAEFKSLSEYKNIRKNNEYLTITLMSMKVLDDLKRSCGLRFKADA